jgi:hypothetical protein
MDAVVTKGVGWSSGLGESAEAHPVIGSIRRCRRIQIVPNLKARSDRSDLFRRESRRVDGNGVLLIRL